MARKHHTNGTTKMAQKHVAYVVIALALAILLSSTARIGIAILSNPKSNLMDNFDFDIDLDLDDVKEYIHSISQSSEEPILPIHKRKLAVTKGESGPGGISDVLPRFTSYASQTRKLDESALPYKCGVIVYQHHLPGENGYELDKWVRTLVESYDNMSLIHSDSKESKKAFINEVQEKLQHIGTKDWIFINTSGHDNGLEFATDSNTLQSWRATVEKQNCHLIASAVFVDPLDHSIKNTKQRFVECDMMPVGCRMEKFLDEIMDDVTNYRGGGQLDHFLFGRDYQQGTTMETKDKVRLAMQLLKDHFDLVTIDGKSDFANDILRIIGYRTSIQMKRPSIPEDGEIVYSKDLISNFGKMSTKNGDADFIDAVNHVYHNSLAYLMLQ